MTTTRFHAKSTGLYIDEVDLTTVSAQVRLVISGRLSEVTAFADTDATFVEGKPGWTCDVNGLWSKASPNVDNDFFTNLTSLERRLGIYPPGTANGEFGWEGKSQVSRNPRVSNLRTAIQLHVTWLGDEAIIRSQILRKDTAVAATVNGTAYNHGAVAAGDKVVGVLRMLTTPGGSGNNDMDVTIESDSQSDFLASKETQLTFTQLNQASAVQVEVKEKNGSITDDWWRVVFTYAGAGSRTFDLLATMGITAQ